MDTQDGILGTNMYAYCLNDPVNLCDPTGFASAFDRAGLRWPGEIHKAVQADIIARNPGMNKEYYVRIKGSTNFRADLYKKMGGKQYIWELKPSGTSNYNKGRKQLETYIQRGETATKDFVQKFEKGGSIASNSFYLYSTLGFGYEVWYWYVGEGVIQYDFRRVEVSESFKESAVYLALGAWTLVSLAVFLGSGGSVALPEPVFT
jgi:hypothetical protein